jgi:hypothetical protein
MAVANGLGLSGTDGYHVESADGEVGWVEEVWVGDRGEPFALALQTTDGRHALLRVEDVQAVERRHHWVVVRTGQELLELAAPRLRRGDGRLVAVWETTGRSLRAPSEPEWHVPIHLAHRKRRPHPPLEATARQDKDLPTWLSLAVLAAGIVVIGSTMMVLAFVIAKVVTGSAY